MAVSKRIRTDLALETTERFAQENTEIRGVEIQEDYDEEKDIRTTVVKIVTENGAKSMGRPQGNCRDHTGSGCGNETGCSSCN